MIMIQSINSTTVSSQAQAQSSIFNLQSSTIIVIAISIFHPVLFPNQTLRVDGN